MVIKLATNREMWWATQLVEDKKCKHCGNNMPHYKKDFCCDKCWRDNRKTNGGIIRTSKNNNSRK